MLSYPDHTTYSLPDPDLAYQWRQNAPTRQVQLVEHKGLDLIVDRGYEPSGLVEIEVSPGEARKLERDSLWRRRRFRLQRYGLSLMLMDNLSRRLPFRHLSRWVEERLHAVDIRHLR